MIHENHQFSKSEVTRIIPIRTVLRRQRRMYVDTSTFWRRAAFGIGGFSARSTYDRFDRGFALWRERRLRERWFYPLMYNVVVS